MQQSDWGWVTKGWPNKKIPRENGKLNRRAKEKVERYSRCHHQTQTTNEYLLKIDYQEIGINLN